MVITDYLIFSLLHCSKAFDVIKHDKLLEKLVAKDVPPVIIRVLMFMLNGTKRYLNILIFQMVSDKG